MDDFLSIALVVIIYLVAALSSDKKKRAKKAKRNNTRTERVNDRRSRQAQRGFAAAFDQAQREEKREENRLERRQEQRAEKKDVFPPKAACSEKRIHLHEVTQEQMSAAGEGVDPCHVVGEDGAFAMEEESPIYNQQTDTRSELAQDVLRGVIMSEILRRPHERAADKRSRMYHG